MTSIQLSIYVIFICLEIFGISFFMEWYKKSLRKGNCKVAEIRLIGLILSFLAVAILLGINIFKPVLGTIGAPIWADCILYVLVIFYLQLQTNMKIVKKIINSFVPSLLRKAGVEESLITDIMIEISKKTN